MIVFLLLYADFTVAGRCRTGSTVPEAAEYLDGVPCRELLQVKVVLEIYLVAVLVTQKGDDRNMRAAACCVLAPGVTGLHRDVNDPVAAVDGFLDDVEGLRPAIQVCASSCFLTAPRRGPAVSVRRAEGSRMRRIWARTASVSAAWTMAMPRSRFISAASQCPEGSSYSGLSPVAGYIRCRISRHEMNSSPSSGSQSLIGTISQRAQPGASSLAAAARLRCRVADRAQARSLGTHAQELSSTRKPI